MLLLNRSIKKEIVATPIIKKERILTPIIVVCICVRILKRNKLRKLNFSFCIVKRLSSAMHCKCKNNKQHKQISEQCNEIKEPIIFLGNNQQLIIAGIIPKLAVTKRIFKIITCFWNLRRHHRI